MATILGLGLALVITAGLLGWLDAAADDARRPTCRPGERD